MWLSSWCNQSNFSILRTRVLILLRMVFFSVGLSVGLSIAEYLSCFGTSPFLSVIIDTMYPIVSISNETNYHAMQPLSESRMKLNESSTNYAHTEIHSSSHFHGRNSKHNLISQLCETLSQNRESFLTFIGSSSCVLENCFVIVRLKSVAISCIQKCGARDDGMRA